MNYQFNLQIVNINLAILLRFSPLAIACLIAVAAVKLRGYSEFGEYLCVVALFQIAVSSKASQNKDVLIRALRMDNDLTLKSKKIHFIAIPHLLRSLNTWRQDSLQSQLMEA